jgi:hypothetical protein
VKTSTSPDFTCFPLSLLLNSRTIPIEFLLNINCISGYNLSKLGFTSFRLCHFLSHFFLNHKVFLLCPTLLHSSLNYDSTHCQIYVSLPFPATGIHWKGGSCSVCQNGGTLQHGIAYSRKPKLCLKLWSW